VAERLKEATRACCATEQLTSVGVQPFEVKIESTHSSIANLHRRVVTVVCKGKQLEIVRTYRGEVRFDDVDDGSRR